MIIHILCSDGSPLGVTSKTVYGDRWRIGVGGAELALITMCEEWAKVGHDVVLYNDPKEEVEDQSFEQRPINAFDPSGKRDVCITFRTPCDNGVVANGLRVWWSTDQYTINDYEKFAPHMNKIVGISDFHSDYFKAHYNVHNMEVIDLPVRIDDFYPNEIEKVKNRLIFTSVPDRGLEHLNRIWHVLVQDIPDISLVITSDYRLWGVGEPRNESHRVLWLEKENIEFIGAIPRERMVQEVLKAELMVYPCTYDELFCISVAEAQVAGVYPITSTKGALATTNLGSFIDGDPTRNGKSYIERTIDLLGDRGLLLEHTAYIQEQALERFSPKRILKEWDKRVFS